MSRRPGDLDRERRLAELDRRAAALAASPGGRAALAGALHTLSTAEDTMNEKQLSLRLPDAFIERADALVPLLDRVPEHQAARVTTSYVLRLAIALGLAALEAAHGPTGREG